MVRSPWMLPEGVDEALPAEAARLEALRRAMLDRLACWGYRLVIPPLVEHLDSLLTGSGGALDLQTFKLVDPLSGRSLGVRADMTPQVARIDARHLGDQGPARLCYLGTVLRAMPDTMGAARSPVQVGAELYGHPGVEGDCEIAALMTELLTLAGIAPLHLDLGHVGVFRALVRAVGLDARGETALHEVLQRKARPELRQLLASLDCPPALRHALAALADLNGDLAVLDEAASRIGGVDDAVDLALAELARLCALLGAQAGNVVLHVDLAELRGYDYHTGTVFAAFTPAHGQEIARGGRYDHIGEVFGRARPATGFSADLKLLARLGAFDAPAGAAAITAPWSEDPALALAVRGLRAAGERVVTVLPGAPAVPGCDRELVAMEDGWVVRPVTAD